MTIQEWLTQSTDILAGNFVPTADLDVQVLLADSLGEDRSWIHAHPDLKIDEVALKTLDRQVKRRATHEPLAYIRGKQEFYGHEFIVSHDTLTPRPETETLVELTIKHLGGDANKVKGLNIIDVGTGSGCIIISTAQIIDDSSISYTGLDISKNALKIARQNAINHNVDIDFVEFNLLSENALPKIFNNSVVLANLPYVPDEFSINLAASHEPRLAIYGGKDGLDLYRSLFEKTQGFDISTIITESLPVQHSELAGIATNAGFKLLETEGFIQVFRKT